MSTVHVKQGTGPTRISVTLEVVGDDPEKLERLGQALADLLDEDQRRELTMDLTAALTMRPFPAD